MCFYLSHIFKCETKGTPIASFLITAPQQIFQKLLYVKIMGMEIPHEMSLLKDGYKLTSMLYTFPSFGRDQM